MEGASVICTDLRGDRAVRVSTAIEAAGGTAVAVEADHCRADDCERTVATAVATYGRLDVLVNNAGAAVLGSVLDVSLEDWRRQFRLNVEGPLLMLRAAIPALRDSGGGSIVMMGSSASLGAQPGGAAYVASKHALLGLARAAAVEHAADNIRVNVICPAVVDTPLAQQLFEHRAGTADGSSADAVRQQVARAFPLGRIGDPSDVASVALHFASAESAWTTGCVYALDGGRGY